MGSQPCQLLFEYMYITKGLRPDQEGLTMTREMFKKLPGGRGFVLTEYELVASHGHLIHDNLYGFGTQKLAHLRLIETNVCVVTA